MQVGERLKAAAKVFSQCGFPCNDSVAIFQQIESDGRDEADFIFIMRQDSFQVVAVPGIDPFLSELTRE